MTDLFFENIDKYVWDECSDSEMSMFLDHIQSCDKCRAEYELACSIKDAMPAMTSITPPADFSELVNRRLDKELQAPKTRQFTFASYRRYSAVAACVVLAAVLGVNKTAVFEKPVIEQTGVFEHSLQPSTEDTEPVNVPEPSQASPTSPVTEESSDKIVGTTSTITKPTIQPAAENKPSKPDKPAPTQSSYDITNKLPKHLDPSENVVLASSVEKTYQISGITPEDVTPKERDLTREFSLLQNPKTGVIVANDATINSMQGVKFVSTDAPIVQEPAKEYGVGSGSILISTEDKEIIHELLGKYLTTTESNYYFFTGDNFESFLKELDNRGIDYHDLVISEKGTNVAINLILAQI